MPKIEFDSATLFCEKGENLRKVLLRNNLPLYNGIAKTIHCRGLGTCGTCAIEIEGEVTPLTKVEEWRLDFPPHKKAAGKLRLACQCEVVGDLKLTKYQGLWGHKISEE